jgi:predicted RNase H-like HicB family nuclease
MSTDSKGGGDDAPELQSTITLTHDGESWTARDEETGVASCGATREEALAMLDEAVALYEGEIGESIDTWEAERDVLKELGVDPEEVKQAREEHDGLPEFLQ